MYPLARHAQKSLLPFPNGVGRGMDQLKKALAQLDDPQCPNCRITMRWFRSELVRDTPDPIIAHFSSARTANARNGARKSSLRYPFRPTNWHLRSCASYGAADRRASPCLISLGGNHTIIVNWEPRIAATGRTMCEKCINLDKKIERYRKMASPRERPDNRYRNRRTRR
jgi:hypothetical protein